MSYINTDGTWDGNKWIQPYQPYQPYRPLVPQVYPNTSTQYINWNLEYVMTEKDIDAVADRVIEKLKSELLGTMLKADPKAVMALLLKAVAEE